MNSRVKQLAYHHITLCFSLTVIVILMNLLSSLSSLNVERSRTLYVTSSSSIQCLDHTEPCLTLSQFAKNSSNWISPHTILIFLAGNHTLNADLFISNFSMLTNPTSEGTHVVVICQLQAYLDFDHANEIRISGLKFVGCGSNRFSSVKRFTVENSTFQGHNDSGTALDITDTNLTIVNSSFLSNRVGTCNIIDIESSIAVGIGGAILVSSSNISIIRCKFWENSAEIGGGIYTRNGSNINIINSTFVNNQATTSNIHIRQDCLTNNSIADKVLRIGGAIASFDSRLTINSCTFINNTSDFNGGALSIQLKSVAAINKTKFYGNRANGSGGVLIIILLTNVTIESSIFLMNSAGQGGVIHVADASEVMGLECVYEKNMAVFGGVMSIDQDSLFYDNQGQFYDNRARAGGALYVIRSQLFLAYSVFSYNQALEFGGGMYMLQCQQGVTFNGFSSLTYNYAGIGGAIYAVESTLDVYVGQLMTIKFNIASHSGGGIFLYRSTLSAELYSITDVSCNKAEIGGGIYAINSIIVCTQSYRRGRTRPFQTLMFFSNNSANKGGGLLFESGAQLRMQKVGDDTILSEDKINTSIYFISNSAQDGSAVYVADETYFDVCGGSRSVTNIIATVNTECFIQVLSDAKALTKELNPTSIEFIINDSNSTDATVIFGGLLDRCVPDPRAEIFVNDSAQKEINGFTYLELISNIKDTEYVSSLPVRVCFCTSDNQPDCSYEPPIIHVKKGENFNVSLVAVDQVNHTLKNVEIYSSLSHTESSLGEGQTTQVTRNACTNLTFSIYSPHASEKLILYAEGPCRNASISQNRVYVIFQPCTCPIGFQQKYKDNDCVCMCDSRLNPYFTEADNNCNFQNESLDRRGHFWIGFINDSTSYEDGSVNSSGFLIYPYCPLDYCLPPSSDVHINLNVFDGADAQCANNRSGLLCSLCQAGLSLSHGSSQCISCFKSWYKGFVSVVVISILAGILLVASLMTLNLTVAIGTLNGLVFFANIVGANSSTFFSGLSPLTRFYSILISWFNLEVGFDICFFEGMDTYWKTWLQLAFPAYVILLVAITIIVSEHSMRFSRLIAKRNPVATLATLILLSYTKFLQTTITTLSLATLHYPDGSHKRVWLPDATVEYLSGKHIALFVVAIIILIVGTAYTFIIFFWQWLLHHQHWNILKWTYSQPLCHFIEPYHAPYVSKHRYWTGLLLITRIALYLVFALNVSGDPGVNLLAIIISVIILLVIKGQVGRVYKSIFVDIFETACYTNLCVFSAVRLKFGNEEIVDITASLSGVVILLLLVFVFSYHVYTTFCSKCLKIYQNSTESQVDNSEQLLHNDNTLAKNDYSEITFSVVELKLPGSGRKSSESVSNQSSEESSESNNETALLISAK